MDVLLRFAVRQNPSMARPALLDDRCDSGERWPWRNGFCSNRNAASECSPAVWPACGCGFSSRPPTPLTGRGCDRSLQHRVLRHSAIIGKRADLGTQPTPIGARMTGRMPRRKRQAFISWVHAFTGAKAEVADLIPAPIRSSDTMCYRRDRPNAHLSSIGTQSGRSPLAAQTTAGPTAAVQPLVAIPTPIHPQIQTALNPPN